MACSERNLTRRIGAQAVPATSLQVSVFRHESCLCCFFEFPPTRTVGEALLGLIIAGPSATWGPGDFAKVQLRYYLLQLVPDGCTFIRKWSPSGFEDIRPGPAPGSPVTAFADLVFEHAFHPGPPNAEQAARRLLILNHLVLYAQASTYGKLLHQSPDLAPAAKDDLHAIMGGLFSKRLREEGLWDHVSPAERQFFDCHVANLAPQQVINASWRSEAIATLLWALDIVAELPPYDTPVGGEISKKVPPASFISTARLRDQKQIDHARQTAELWHWRSRTRQLKEEGRPFEPNQQLRAAGIHTMDDVVRITAQTVAKEGDLPPCIGDDFPAKGKAYRDLTADEWVEVRSVSVERHFTLNWLCGYAPHNEWDRTPTGT